MGAGKGKNVSSRRTEVWQVPVPGGEYEVHVTFKQMRTIRLRVAAGGQVCLSAPLGMDRRLLEQFVADRAGWIAANAEKMRQVPLKKLPPLTAQERRRVLSFLQPLVDRWYPVVGAFGVPRPHVTVRAMSTRYGTCSVGRARITLSSVLAAVPEACAEYVVFHELVHFLYPHHDRQFYDFIGSYMPDWREREWKLKEAAEKTLG